MKCELYFKLAPLGQYRQGTCTLSSPVEFQKVFDYCERAGLIAGSLVGNSFTFKADEFDPRLLGLIELLGELDRFPVWSSFSPLKGDSRYFCVRRHRVFSEAEIEAAKFFSNVEWGSGLICAARYVDDGVVCIAKSFDRNVKAGWVNFFGGGFLIRNEVKDYFEECGLRGVGFREVRFDVEGFMRGDVWELISDKFVSGCLLPSYGTGSDSDGEIYEVFQYDDAGILPVQLRFRESELDGLSGWDFVAVCHQVPSVRWSTAHSFLFSKKMVEALKRFRGRFRWSPVVAVT